MNEEVNWDDEFQDIVRNIDIETPPEEPIGDETITPMEVARAIAGANEAATFLGRYLLQKMHDDSIEVPPVASALIRDLVMLTDEVSAHFVDNCYCDACLNKSDCLDCDGEILCETCLDDLLNEDEEEDFN